MRSWWTALPRERNDGCGDAWQQPLDQLTSFTRLTVLLLGHGNCRHFGSAPRKYRRLPRGKRRRPTSLRHFLFVCFQQPSLSRGEECYWILLIISRFPSHMCANIVQCKSTWKCIIYNKNTDTSSQAFEPKWRYVAPLKKKRETT